MKYFVSIEGKEYQVMVEGDQVAVDGQSYRAHLSQIPGTPLRHLLLGDRSFTLTFEGRGAGNWSMAFQGEVWEAQVIDERTRHIRSLTGAGDAKKGGGVLKAPMPGLVLRIDVVAGQRLEAGASLVVLEAMKMQNELRAQSAVVVAALKVTAGQIVEKGEVLVEFAAE
ncbi:MAG: biotin/lipoyl-containing protein [Gemmatimonadota bacterium]